MAYPKLAFLYKAPRSVLAFQDGSILPPQAVPIPLNVFGHFIGVGCWWMAYAVIATPYRASIDVISWIEVKRSAVPSNFLFWGYLDFERYSVWMLPVV